MKKLLLLSIALYSFIAFGQSTISTNFTNNNGSGMITFNFQNTNASDVIKDTSGGTITPVGGIDFLEGPVTKGAFYKDPGNQPESGAENPISV